MGVGGGVYCFWGAVLLKGGISSFLSGLESFHPVNSPKTKETPRTQITPIIRRMFLSNPDFSILITPFYMHYN